MLKIDEQRNDTNCSEFDAVGYELADMVSKAYKSLFDGRVGEIERAKVKGYILEMDKCIDYLADGSVRDYDYCIGFYEYLKEQTEILYEKARYQGRLDALQDFIYALSRHEG